jgi:GAF domain-containing protein
MWKEEAEARLEAELQAEARVAPRPRPVEAPPPLTGAEPAGPRSPGRDRIAETALDALTQRFPRAMLLMSGQEAIQGWAARGAGLTRERIANVRIPWGDPSIFAFVKLSGTPHRGGLSRVLMPPVLSALLGPRAAASCAVFPVRIKDRLVAFLYVDRMGAPLNEEDHRALEAAASSLGSSLARLLLELRRAAPAS